MGLAFTRTVDGRRSVVHKDHVGRAAVASGADVENSRGIQNLGGRVEAPCNRPVRHTEIEPGNLECAGSSGDRVARSQAKASKA